MAAVDRWAINESLLQSYRATFISTQSFLLAVGAVLSGKSAVLVYLAALIGVIVIWAVWFPVVRARHRIVDYYKYSSGLTPEQASTLCTEREYVHDVALRARANETFGLRTNWRSTRVKLDAWLPVLFSAMWLALVVHECLSGRGDR